MKYWSVSVFFFNIWTSVYRLLYEVHKSPLLDMITSQIWSVHILTPSFFKTDFNKLSLTQRNREISFETHNLETAVLIQPCTCKLNGTLSSRICPWCCLHICFKLFFYSFLISTCAKWYWFDRSSKMFWRGETRLYAVFSILRFLHLIGPCFLTTLFSDTLNVRPGFKTHKQKIEQQYDVHYFSPYVFYRRLGTTVCAKN